MIKDLLWALFFLLLLIMWKGASSLEVTQQIKNYSGPPEKPTEMLASYGIKFPEIVLAQAILETQWFSSTIFKENKNMFGMKFNKRGWAIGTNRGHAEYEKLEDSISDYAAWQAMVLKLKPAHTREEYYALLEDLPFKKGNSSKKLRYATDRNYVAKVKKIVKIVEDCDF
jgi:flagellum-specific peptidoglycan hydrolase FlgJ